MRSSRLYLITFLLAGLAVWAVCRVGIVADGVMSCRVDTNPNVFMAYCDNRRVGDYEHGAFYLGLEPKALDYLRKAKVLFLGNSRTQVAFSTDVVAHYFAERHLPFYTLGFGYKEASAFSAALIEKERLSPRALVIVADPFFSKFLSKPAAALIGRDRSLWQRVDVWREYVLKKWLTRAAVFLCRKTSIACAGTTQTIYRSVTNGTWIWRDYLYPATLRGVPVDVASQHYLGPALAAADEPLAADFLKAAHVPASCVVLTVAPNSEVNARDYVEAIGRDLGAQVVVPELANITLTDGSHMSWSSAQRWSAAVLRAIDPLIKRCTGGEPVLAGRRAR